ncbi:hypothetical protein PAXINDRAFT_16755 [Paxillus involutus ATCC 200175]|uniref:Uncharacterized protein n=1 Tax=Paxillus involutus ATCC 200175 TaxID=664439 RepID=A0A0C9THL1_PAXIN|nr:hypothetical protein PAXINDRAFT_16755 [Paxillus involutus ATCC 200175]
MLSSILKPAAPIDPIEAEKMAAREAFKAAVTNVHVVTMSRDSDALEEEEEIVVVRAPPKTGKGKRKGRAITLNKQEADEVMKVMMGFEVRIRDTQARLVELESDVLSLRGLLEGHRG